MPFGPLLCPVCIPQSGHYRLPTPSMWVPCSSSFQCGSGDQRQVGEGGWDASVPLLRCRSLGSIPPRPQLPCSHPFQQLQPCLGSGSTVPFLSFSACRAPPLLLSLGCCTVSCVSPTSALPRIKIPIIKLSLGPLAVGSCFLPGSSLTSSHNNNNIVKTEASLAFRIMEDFNSFLIVVDTKGKYYYSRCVC